MQEPDRRSVPRGQDGSFGQPVQARGRLAQTTVGQVRSLPFPGLVPAALPLDAVLTGQHFVKTLHASAFDAAQLIHGPALRGRLAEPHVVHLPHHLEPGLGVQGQPCLKKQAIGTRPTRLAGRVEPDPSLTHPHQQTADPPGKRDGCM